jgi:hypothetical protein
MTDQHPLRHQLEFGARILMSQAAMILAHGLNEFLVG